ncbi:serine/threonine-protein kinase [Planobispora rosea]|nr:serine/threonine-protein kinase [Planobispora rosea]
MPEDRLRALARRYQLQAPLGEGGMGVVWRAWDELLHQPVAVKEVTLPASLPAPERERRVRRTLREARVAARLRDHPGIVTVYDVVEEDGLPWIVMELVDGPSLAEVIRTGGRLPEARVAELGHQVISALAAAEAAGVVHRDVKPANILLKDGRAVLTDFGIAAAAHDASGSTGSGPPTGALTGTPAYLAPEQIDGRPASAASDLWAVGVTLYQAVEGRKPFERESVVATIAAIVNQPPAPFRYADRLRPVIDGLLRKDPAGRLTAQQALTLLAPVSTGKPARGRVAVAAGPVRGRVAVAAGSVLAAAAVTTVIVWGVQRGDARPGVTPSAGSSVRETAAGGPVRSPGQGTAAPSDAAASLPRGFTLHTDSRGFSIAVPDDWTKDESGSQVSWERPRGWILSSSWYLGAFAHPERKEARSPTALLDALRVGLQDQKLIDPASYRELSRKEVPYPDGHAAELEFRFSHPDAAGRSFRLYARCLVRDSGGVGLFWFFVPAGEWAEAGTHLDTFVSTFRLI